MKQIKQKTFDKKVKEGRLEVVWEVTENHHYKIVEIRKGKGTEVIQIVKE